MFSGHEERNFQITKNKSSGVKPNTNLHAAFEVSTTKIVVCTARAEKKKTVLDYFIVSEGSHFKITKVS